MLLESYVQGSWTRPTDEGTPLRHAATGEEVARVSTAGIDFRAVLRHARDVGGPALRASTFHERAATLKQLALHLDARKEELYELSAVAGATRSDALVDVDGGIGTLFVYASKGRRELPDGDVVLDGPPEQLGRRGTFAGQHVYVPLRGAAVQVNAFNFPVWGMLEKFAPAFLAGVPTVVKPASPTAFLAAAAVRHLVASGLLPEGALQFVCGPAGDLLDHLTGQDLVLFTGSASTARVLRAHPSVLAHAVRFNSEADSLNCAILGPDAGPGTEEFDLYVAEVVREMVVKAGQKCTAIRRAIVPRAHTGAVVEALRERLGRVRVGHPEHPEVTMGPLASAAQRDEVRRAVDKLAAAGEVRFGDLDGFEVVGADRERGAFLPPVLLECTDPDRAEPHDVEAFGPVCTVLPYDGPDHAVELARRGQGSLVGSLFTADPEVARTVVLGVAPYHGRLLVVDAACAREQTGHGSPLPHLVHGGPGRAGGGEELGGVRGVLHFMQRTAVQGSPAMLTAIGRRWVRGAPRAETGTHPFRRTFDDLRLGESLVSAEREVTLADVEAFAELTGDRFYAHMDDDAARANPFFEGRVAHGYLVVSLAAGLFVDPHPGPVLANYGLENLRFLTPVYPGDRLRVTLTCAQKLPRTGEAYGEVRWDAQVTNQDGATVASYEVLTLVARSVTP